MHQRWGARGLSIPVTHRAVLDEQGLADRESHGDASRLSCTKWEGPPVAWSQEDRVACSDPTAFPGAGQGV